MNKIKVGFGPETTANSFYQSGVKVAGLLNEDDRFECIFFKEPMEYGSLSKFDILIFIKIAPSAEVLKRLKSAGKILILDYQDMFLFPSVYEQNYIKKVLKKIYYFGLEAREKQRYANFDCCLVSSPASEKIVTESGMKPYFIFRQIYNDWNREHPKVHSDKTSELTILWTGVPLNLGQNKPVEPILQKIYRKHRSRVIYLTQLPERKEGGIEYKRWSVETWEKELLQADIAFRWWEKSNDQYHKDSNKIISYMAAGLPVVCRPTAADKLVIEHGKTGFFAETISEFEQYIEKLIVYPQLRREIGNSAFKEVWSKYSLDKHVEELKKIILNLRDECHRNKANG